MRGLIALALLSAPIAAHAQDSYPPTDAREALRQATAAVATANAAKAAVPVPSDGVPPSEMVGGAAGSAPTFRRADAAAPRITRAAIVTTDTGGAWAVTWKVALPATPVVLPIPIVTGTQPVVCVPSVVSATGASGWCRLARALPATILSLTAIVAYDVLGQPAPGAPVQVLAIPTTQ